MAAQATITRRVALKDAPTSSRKPANLRLLLATSLREAIEADIERLIDMLDQLDGDPDVEPSLGCSPFAGSARDVDLEGDYSDYEPSLA